MDLIKQIYLLFDNFKDEKCFAHNGYHPDWYDKNAKLISRKPGCSVISYQCNGTGILYDYSIFPGIDLIFMDFNCSNISISAAFSLIFEQ